MRLTIQLDMSTTAFESAPFREAARVLRALASQVADGPSLKAEAGDSWIILDYNGVTVGHALLEGYGRLPF